MKKITFVIVLAILSISSFASTIKKQAKNTSLQAREVRWVITDLDEAFKSRDSRLFRQLKSEALDQIDLGERNPDAPLRVPILDKMKVDNNLVVYGKVEAGTINIDDKLAIMPSGAPVQVLKIYDSTK